MVDIINDTTGRRMFSRSILDSIDNPSNITFKYHLKKTQFQSKNNWPAACKDFDLSYCLWEGNTHWKSTNDSTSSVPYHHANTCRIWALENCTIKVSFVLIWLRRALLNWSQQLGRNWIRILAVRKSCKRPPAFCTIWFRWMDWRPSQRQLCLFHKSQEMIIKISALRSLDTFKKWANRLEKSPGGIATELRAQLSWLHTFSSASHPHTEWRISLG